MRLVHVLLTSSLLSIGVLIAGLSSASAADSCSDGAGDFCGGQSDDGCWCDSQCSSFGDCCPDIVAVCQAPPVPEPIPVNSCSDGAGNFCGGQSDNGCWCDSQCSSFGDCCPDIVVVCQAPPVPEPEPTPIVCQGVAQYRVTLNTNWIATGVPNPHWSPLIGGTHNSGVSFWDVGKVATDGVEVMAETGDPNPLRGEIESAISAGTANQVVQGAGIATASGDTSVVFSTSGNFPLLTLSTMMAPSPDWFVGVDNVSLCGANGQWLQGTVNMVLYDSGTDSGTVNTAANSETSPAAPIGLAQPFVQDGTPISLGSMTIELLSEQ